MNTPWSDAEQIDFIIRRWPPASKDALVAALLKDRAPVLEGEWMEEGCGSERIYEGIDLRTVPENELGVFLKAERVRYYVIPVPKPYR